MIRILLVLVLLATALPMAASEPLTFKQTLARVAQEREPGVMMDVYGEYPVSGTTFWAAVIEFLGPERVEVFPPYIGTPKGQEWFKVFPMRGYLREPTVFLGNPDPLQRLNIAAFLDTHYN